MVTRDEAQSLVNLAREYYVSGFGRGEDFYGRPGSIIESADGHYAVDIYGNRLLDTETCASACYLGFGRPEVMDALKAEMARTPSTTPLFVPTAPLLRLGEKLAAISPGDLKYSVFSANGTKSAAFSVLLLSSRSLSLST